MKNSVKNSNPVTYKRIIASQDTPQIISLLKSSVGFAATVGFFLSRTAFFGTMAPLGIAWYAVCGALDKSSLVAAGCLLGAFFSPVGMSKIKYAVALFVFWVIKKYVLSKKPEHLPVSCGVASATLLVCGLLFETVRGFAALDIILCFVESAIVWLCGIIFSKAYCKKFFIML